MRRIFNWQVILILIIILGAFLRIYAIENIPPGIHADEALTGYTAYSILNTGKTQYGTFNLVGLDDFTGGTYPPLYTYVLIPLVYLFGLDIVIDRLPSVIFGIFTIPAFYFLILSLFKNRSVGLIGALLLAVNPWAIHISRQGLLESIALFLVVSGILVFLLAKKREVYYIASALLLGLSLHAYDAPKIFVPLFIPILIVFQWKDLIKADRKILISSISIFLIFFVLMLYALFGLKQADDYSGMSLFNTVEKTVDERRYLSNAPLWLSSIFNNKATVSLGDFTGTYLESFRPNWFFGTGSVESIQRGTGRHGQFYLFELPLILIGLYVLFNKNKKVALFLIAWLLIGVIPGAITKSGNIEYRNVLILLVPIMFSSFGLFYLFEVLSSKNTQSFITRCLIIIFICVSILNFKYIYFFDYPVYAAEAWAKQQNEAIKFAHQEKEKYSKIYIDGGLDWLNMYAFIYKLNPKVFQEEFGENKALGKSKIVEFDNIVMGRFDLDDVRTLSSFEDNSLIITNGDKLKNAHAIKNFYGPGNVRVVFKAVQYYK